MSSNLLEDIECDPISSRHEQGFDGHTVIKIAATLYCDKNYTVSEVEDIVKYIDSNFSDTRIESFNGFDITYANNVKRSV
tara:strand:+ start:8886 stop:9125 length:240 start_codon:yes stop_codon:yes gene_type:complete